jgi:predicted nuclease of predicted toxin-antitoxin system
MAVRVKVDEDLPQQVVDLFTARGHDAISVRQQGWRGTPDADLWSRVQVEGRWLVTADKGFADLRAYPPGTHGGILLLRARPENRRAYLELAARVLERLDLESVPRALVVASPSGIRIRKG